jgi:hypothetical protein
MPKPLKLALRVSVISWCCEWMSPEVQVIGLRHLKAASYQRCADLTRLP